MRKKLFLVMALIALVSLGIIVPISASNWRDAPITCHEVYTCPDSKLCNTLACETLCCSSVSLGSAEEVIDLGNGYIIVREDLMRQMSLEEYHAYMDEMSQRGPVCWSCNRGVIKFLSVETMHHVIRSMPLPMRCESRTQSIHWQCPACWGVSTDVFHLSGCGTNCPVIRP